MSPFNKNVLINASVACSLTFSWFLLWT